MCVNGTNLVDDVFEVEAVAEDAVVLFFLGPFEVGEVVQGFTEIFHFLFVFFG